MRLLIVDDQVLFREGLRSLLALEPDFEVVGQAGHVQEAIERISQLQPDVVLLDLSLADGSGFDVLRAVASRQSQTAIVILTIHDYERYMIEAIRLGARGYLQKGMPFSSLVAALRGIQRGQVAISRNMAGRLVEEIQRLGRHVSDDPAWLSALTARERQVMSLLGAGASNAEIAVKLVISRNTVKVHVHNLLKKLGIKTRSQLAQFAQAAQHNPLEMPPQLLPPAVRLNPGPELRPARPPVRQSTS